MPSEFSRLMAEQIAQARPRQAPSSGPPAVMRGGAGGMGLSGTQTTGEFNVDAGALMRLFGYKTPEEKREISKQLQARRQSISDEDWESYVNQESTQKILKSLEKTGYLGVVQEPSGRFNVPKATPEAAVRGLTPEQIYARGGEPAKRLEAAKQRLKPKSEIDIMSSDDAEVVKSYITNMSDLRKREALAAETPLKKSALQAEMKAWQIAQRVNEIDRKVKEEQLKQEPERWKLEKAKIDAETIKLTKEAFKAEKMGEYYEKLPQKETEKDQRLILKSALDTHRQIKAKLVVALSDTAGVPGSRDQLLRLMTAQTFDHIEAIRQATKGMTDPDTGDPLGAKPANGAIGFWANIIHAEVKDVTKTRTIPIIGREKIHPDEDVRFQRYAMEAQQFIMTMEGELDRGVAKTLLGIITEACVNATPTPKMQEVAIWAANLGARYLERYPNSPLLQQDMARLVQRINQVQKVKEPAALEMGGMGG